MKEHMIDTMCAEERERWEEQQRLKAEHLRYEQWREYQIERLKKRIDRSSGYHKSRLEGILSDLESGQPLSDSDTNYMMYGNDYGPAYLNSRER